ncbi:MAG: rRNA maturation RNase YbeY [Leptospirales bacterium]|nr:rRNA maturation RNase YbeY [Leptospirales bacterium]
MTLHVVTDTGIRKLNRKYRGKDTATDVLSFPLQEFTRSRVPRPIAPVRGPGGILEIGDVFIAAGVCKRQAKEIGHSVHDEFYRLLVHGILHLLGYDHERSEAEEKRMIQKEDELLALV